MSLEINIGIVILFIITNISERIFFSDSITHIKIKKAFLIYEVIIITALIIIYFFKLFYHETFFTVLTLIMGLDVISSRFTRFFP